MTHGAHSPSHDIPLCTISSEKNIPDNCDTVARACKVWPATAIVSIQQFCCCNILQVVPVELHS